MECSRPRFEVAAMAATGSYLACADDRGGVYIVDVTTWKYVLTTLEGPVYSIAGVTDRLFACVLYSGRVWLLNTDGVALIELSQGFTVRSVCAAYLYLVMHVPDENKVIVTTLTGDMFLLDSDPESRTCASGDRLYTGYKERVVYGLGARLVTMPVRGALLEVSVGGVALTQEGPYFYGYDTVPIFKLRFYCRAPNVDEVTIAGDYLAMSRGDELCVMHAKTGDVMVSTRVPGVIQTLLYHESQIFVGHTSGFLVQNI